MKKIKYFILRWRYHRLYRRLFFLYAKNLDYADVAGNEAQKAFMWMTGREWEDWI